MRETILVCSDCGRRNEMLLHKCKCGKVLKELPVCLSCGAVAEHIDSHFCARCGNPFKID